MPAAAPARPWRLGAKAAQPGGEHRLAARAAAPRMPPEERRSGRFIVELVVKDPTASLARRDGRTSPSPITHVIKSQNF